MTAVAGSRDNDNEHSGCLKNGYLLYRRIDHKLFKKHSSLCT
jgi:hypothetical protein